MWFTQISLRNPVFATMVMLALMVLGAFSLQRLQIDQFPNIDFPVVVVTTEYPGASPEIVESEVTQKVEEAVNAVAGVLRECLPEQGLVESVVLAQGEVESAAALALCNAVRGILPVASLGARAWAPHPALAELQERVAMAYPMFSEAGAAA